HIEDANEVSDDACLMCKLGQTYLAPHKLSDNVQARRRLGTAREISHRTSEVNRNWGCHLKWLARAHIQADEKEKAFGYLEQERAIYETLGDARRLADVDER